MTDAELEQIAKEIDTKLKQQVEELKTKEPMKAKSNYKNTLEICEKKLMKNLKDKNNSALFKLYKDSLINHLLEIRDFDCLKLFTTGLGVSIFTDLEAEEKKKSD